MRRTAPWGGGHRLNLHGFGRDAASAAHPERQVVHKAHNRIIAPDENLTVMHEELVCNLPKTKNGFVVVNHKGLSAGIGARHDEE